jgi:signal transduction histidine kinase
MSQAAATLGALLGFTRPAKALGPEAKRARRIVEALITRASTRAELWISSARVVFACLITLRVLTLKDRASPEWAVRAIIELPALALTIVLSMVLLFIVWRRGLAQWVLDASVMLDALAVNLTLLPAVVCPWPAYRGLLHAPDVAIVPVLCLSAGIRMSLRSALVGSLATSLLFGGLLLLDQVRNGQRMAYGHNTMVLFYLYLGAATLLGAVLATRARVLAEQAARDAERAEAARSGLSRVLQDNHDVRSLVSSARLHADLLLRNLENPEREATQRRTSALRHDLTALSEMVEGSRDRAYLELALSAQCEPIDVAEVTRTMTQAAERRFPHVLFALSVAPSAVHALVADGKRGLERILLNLLVNACEGDGKKGATRVTVLVTERDAACEISVSDDGPGFGDGVLGHRSERFLSTKKDGSGLGLFLIENIVVSSGGELHLENWREGARVIVRLVRHDGRP